MIRKIGLDAQRLLFGMDRNEAYRKHICIRCGAQAGRHYLELESLCHNCWMQLAEIADQPFPIEVSIQIGEHIGECVAVPPEWDGFTCLNGFVRHSIAKDELQRLCEVAITDNSVLRLSQEANPHHTVFLVPKMQSSERKELERGMLAMLKLLEQVCAPDVGSTSLLITHLSHDADPNLDQLEGIVRAIDYWNDFRDFGSLTQIFIGAHPDAASRFHPYVERFVKDG